VIVDTVKELLNRAHHEVLFANILKFGTDRQTHKENDLPHAYLH